METIGAIILHPLVAFKLHRSIDHKLPMDFFIAMRLHENNVPLIAVFWKNYRCSGWSEFI